jgi:uroporphyrinogen-III synthase
MAILLTRPQPDNETTAASLRERGFDVLLAPMLRFEPVGLPDGPGANYAAIIVTSANALRAVEQQLEGHGLLGLPLFAVGERTAAAARRAGFGTVISAAGNAADLRDLILAKAQEFRTARPWLYLAGADRSRDLAGELGEHGLQVVMRTTYRMVASSVLPPEACDAIAANQVEAVLHYSARSAHAFLDAVRAAGVEISALAVPQCCISATVASILREAGATRVTVASSPDENALLNALLGMLDRALRA